MRVWQKSLPAGLRVVNTGQAIPLLACKIEFMENLSMSLKIKIREATKSDLVCLARLNAIFNGSKDTAEKIAKRLASPKCVEIPIIAEVENQIVGFAGLRVVPYLFYEGAHAELTELFVEEDYRRKGVGKALVEYAECLAKERYAEELILHTGQDNQVGREFYIAMGFEEWEIVMGKTLVSI